MAYDGCPRCAGLMVVDELLDARWAEACPARRCLNCGHWDDPIAARQRVCPPAPVEGRRLPRPVMTGVYPYKF